MDRWIYGGGGGTEGSCEGPNKEENERLVGEALPEDGWIDDIAEEMTEEIWRECLMLWEAVETVERDAENPDHISWKGVESGKYTAKTTYGMLCQGSMRWIMSKPVWGSFAPMKCKIFAWLAVKYRLCTSDRRARHGLREMPDAFFTCLLAEDNADHILVLYPWRLACK
jgi:hypothetical protein